MKKAFVVYGIATVANVLLAAVALSCGEIFVAGCFVVGAIAFGSGSLYACVRSRR